ncbi:MAG: hypothetical protein QGG40_17325 [Myxococcota bacterium]|jgi:hypothetical protein|nr:hypothetical protein [Myxococcota bacterium]
MRSFLLLSGLLLCACKGDDTVEGAGEAWTNYVSPEGTYLELAPEDLPDGTPLLVSVDADSWQIREGTEWDDALHVAVHQVTSDAGLWVDEDQILPARLTEGETGEGVEVTHTGDFEVWYGTFPDTVQVEVAEGTWAGTQVFAPGLGLIHSTYLGEVWELTYYER